MARKSGSAGGSLVRVLRAKWVFDVSGRYKYVIYVGLEAHPVVPLAYLYRRTPLSLSGNVVAQDEGSLVIVNVLQL